jgi:hypothetical protein
MRKTIDDPIKPIGGHAVSVQSPQRFNGLRIGNCVKMCGQISHSLTLASINGGWKEYLTAGSAVEALR